MIASQPDSVYGGCPDTAHERPDTSAYLLFDTPFCSEIALPELPECRSNEAFVSIRVVDDGQIDPAKFVTRHDWRDGHGELICRCARRESDYLLSLPQQANFHIDMGGIINCVPAPGIGQGVLRQLLLNQVLPRYLAQTGEFLLHASAVTLPNGNSVAFMGDSGFGKSTLASYCHLQGAHIIDDDCILLRSCDRGIRILGGVPTLRLYPDSLHALGLNPAGFMPYADSSTKLQMNLAETATGNHKTPVLDALFLLRAPGDVPTGSTVSIEPAGGQAAMMATLGSAFNLDPSDPGTMLRTFRHAAQTLTGGLPVYHLNFPRQHAALPRVLQAMLDITGA